MNDEFVAIVDEVARRNRRFPYSELSEQGERQLVATPTKGGRAQCRMVVKRHEKGVKVYIWKDLLLLGCNKAPHSVVFFGEKIGSYFPNGPHSFMSLRGLPSKHDVWKVVICPGITIGKFATKSQRYTAKVIAEDLLHARRTGIQLSVGLSLQGSQMLYECRSDRSEEVAWVCEKVASSCEEVA